MRSLGLLNNHSSNTTQTTNNYEHLKKIINGEVINKEQWSSIKQKNEEAINLTIHQTIIYDFGRTSLELVKLD